jgi:hypothetical protein
VTCLLSGFESVGPVFWQALLYAGAWTLGSFPEPEDRGAISKQAPGQQVKTLQLGRFNL